MLFGTGYGPMKRTGVNVRMIDLTRLNGTHFTLNCDLIKYAEAAPDTTVTLVSGEKLIVLEPLEELKRSVMAYRGSVLRTAWPDGAPVLPVAHDPLPGWRVGQEWEHRDRDDGYPRDKDGYPRDKDGAAGGYDR